MKDFKKVTYEMKEEDILNTIPDNVKKVFDEIIDDYKINIINSLIDCESPIEQLLSLKLNERLYKYYSVNGNIEILGNQNNPKIVVDGKTYRVDILLEIAFKTQNKYLDIFRLIIECDGHEFHEKTKEQVVKDNEKNRALQKAGYEVLRFSGSEIYKNINKCVNEIIKFIYSKYNMFLDKEEN